MNRTTRKSLFTRLSMLTVFLTLTSFCFAAQSTQTLGPGTDVTGQCQGHESEPGCVLPSLFGPTGLTLAPSASAFNHYAHFIGSAQTTLNQSLSSAIATQMANLPIISPSSGFTYRYDRVSGAFVRTTGSFGPIYTERAETVGRDRVSLGISYQRFRFNKINGINLHNIPAVFTHVPDTGPGNAMEPYEADVISTTNNLKLNMDQLMLFGTVGITDRLDVSVAIPLASVRMGATSNATIFRLSGDKVILLNMTTPIDNPHRFDDGTLSHVFSSSGSASGIGDITIRAKETVLQYESTRVALALDVRTPSGNARQFLGSGALGVKPFLSVSVSKRVAPHANIGYQWNGRSILAGNITGTTVFEDSTGAVKIQTGPATKQKLPGQFYYALGVDIGMPKQRMTFALDYLGQVLFNAPRVTQTTKPYSGEAETLPLATIDGVKGNMVMSSGVAGLKYNLYRNLLLTGDVLFGLDKKGLRQNVTPLVALSYTFGK